MSRAIAAAAATAFTAGAFAQVIEFESGGLKYQALTRGGITVMVAPLTTRILGYSIVQVAVQNGSGETQEIRPDNFRFQPVTGRAVPGLSAQAVVDDVLDRAGRNDVGRVAEYGSVRVPTYMTLERYSHVMHLVSIVEGRLKEEYDRLDALVACFPAGTVSGAPKVRAMEIIAELENRRRGVYAGAVGYLDFAGNLDFCITIRTVVIENGRAYVQAGAGIVADSNPAAEYEETRDKARAVIRALELAQAGLS